MQLPFSTSARSEAMAAAAANISGISCHSRELFESFPTTTAHVVHTLQTFDVRGVASDLHYFTKASLCVFRSLSTSVTSADLLTSRYPSCHPLLHCCSAGLSWSRWLVTVNVACGVTREHTMAQQLQGTFDTKKQ